MMNAPCCTIIQHQLGGLHHGRRSNTVTRQSAMGRRGRKAEQPTHCWAHEAPMQVAAQGAKEAGAIANSWQRHAMQSGFLSLPTLPDPHSRMGQSPAATATGRQAGQRRWRKTNKLFRCAPALCSTQHAAAGREDASMMHMHRQQTTLLAVCYMQGPLCCRRRPAHPLLLPLALRCCHCRAAPGCTAAVAVEAYSTHAPAKSCAMPQRSATHTITVLLLLPPRPSQQPYAAGHPAPPHPSLALVRTSSQLLTLLRASHRLPVRRAAGAPSSSCSSRPSPCTARCRQGQ